MNTNVKSMTTRELLDEYNLLTGKSTKRFSSRAAGEEAVRRARSAAGHPETKIEESKMPENEQLNTINEVLEEEQGETAETAETAEADETDEAGETTEATEATETGEATEAAETAETAETGETGEAPAKKEMTDEEKAASHLRRSESVTQSWANPSVKAARTSRAGAKVAWEENGESQEKEYASVAKAFADLGLPLSVHIAFRTKMRADGVNTIKKGDVEYTFTAVEKGKVGKSAEEKEAERQAKIAARLAKKEARIAEAKAAKAAKTAKQNKASSEESQGGEDQAA